MKTCFGIAVIMVVLGTSAAWGAFVYPSLAQVSYAYYGNGARAMAMGNAFVGLANDISGGTWNPAGIWALERPMISTSYRLFSPKGEFTDKLTPGTTTNDLNLNGIGQFSFVAPVRIKGHPWVFNFNYNLNNDFAYQEKYLANSLSGYNPDSYIEDKGYLRSYNFGLSTRIYKQLSMGFTCNIYDGRRVYSTDAYSTRDSVLNALYPEETTVKILSDAGSLDSTTSSGFNMTVGTMYKAGKLSVGLVVQTPFKMSHTTQRAFFNITSMGKTTQLPDLNSSDTIYVIDSIAKQDIPLSGTLGFAYAFKENIHATFDIGYQKYGNTSWYYRTMTMFSAGGDRTDVYAKEPTNWENSYGIGAGLEYIRTTGIGRIPLRCGFRMDYLPEPKNLVYTLDSATVEISGANTKVWYSTLNASERRRPMAVSLGTGIHWSLIELDVAYRYTFGNEIQVTQKGNFIANTVRTTKEKAHEFKCTFTGYF